MTGQDQTFYELKERFEEASRRPDREVCPICQLTEEGVTRYLGSISYENVNDPAVREQLRAAGGFCNRHAWQWYSLKDAQGTAIIYHDIARLFIGKLQDGSLAEVAGSRHSNPGLLAALFSPNDSPSHTTSKHEMGAPGMERREDLGLARCPACQVQDELEERLIEEYVGGLEEAGFRVAYQSSAGICIPHLVWALSQLSNEAAQQFVIKNETRLWSQIEQDLALTVDKFNFDHHRGQLKLGQEANAIFRSLWKAAGMQGMA